ncbi:MAG: BREX-2 system adenine-specific DNA-methyltransferase PglX [Candidatus Competibacteraceae bacterium]|nr:BREX-2 system adenine-specific DNA-methyltransferase PglX [Candidatus Competibacteraceae bacterium]
MDSVVLWPYDDKGHDLPEDDLSGYLKFLWDYRVVMKNRKAFGVPVEKRGLRWWDIREVYRNRLSTPLSITFAFVATHNHFVLDRGGKVFKQSAPVIKLPKDATEADHLALLGLLNSSTAMFWMRQVFHGKGQGGVGQESRAEWEEFREFTGTGMKAFPVPNVADSKVLHITQTLDTLAKELATLDPAQILGNWSQDRSITEVLTEAKARQTAILQKMIAWQEQLDWHNYRLYGLTDDDLCCTDEPPPVELGQRPFEIHLARRMAAGEAQTTWFQRHNSTPITEIPDSWPTDYRQLTERRLATIRDNRWIALVEQPEYKRRWNREPWDKRRQRALQQWLLDHLETRCQGPELLTAAQLTDRVRHDDAFQQVAALYTGTPDFDPQKLVVELVEGDQVPQMAACRYKPKAMPKFRAWQETWELQRREDAIDQRITLDPSDPQYLTPQQAEDLKAQEVGDIPLPPKYASGDFLKASYWPLRGKLDVPKERFFSLPHCRRAGDNTPVIGWAGLDHLQRATAIAGWYLERKEQDGWNADQLKPLLVALDELIPWLKQWHNHLDPEFGERIGDYYQGFLLEELRQLGLPRDELADWRPPAAVRGRRRG